MDDFMIISKDKEHLKEVRRKIEAYLCDIELELNEKTNIFPLRNGIDFLGFHTYITETGKIICKLRHSSSKRMKKKLKVWERDYPEKISKEKILEKWNAWDAHAAHGQTLNLRKEVAARVSKIIGEEVFARPKIRDSEKLRKKIARQCGWHPDMENGSRNAAFLLQKEDKDGTSSNRDKSPW